MPAISSKTLADGAVSPVNHTFDVVTTNGQTAKWAERTAGKPNGFLSLYHEVRQPATAKSAYQIKIGLNVPVTETVGGVPTVTRNSSLLCTLNFSQESTEAERKDLHAYLASFLANADVKTATAKLEPFF